MKVSIMMYDPSVHNIPDKGVSCLELIMPLDQTTSYVRRDFVTKNPTHVLHHEQSHIVTFENPPVFGNFNYLIAYYQKILSKKQI